MTHDANCTTFPGSARIWQARSATGLQTGKFPFLEELRQQVPAGLRELLRVPGLGPKKSLTLFQELHIDTPEKLRQAALEHRLRKLKGFGAKTEDNILQGLANLGQISRRMYLAEAKVYAEAVTRHLQQTPGMGHITVAGSFRRRKETVGDLDILATCADPRAVMDRLAGFEGVVQVLAKGETKMTVRLRIGLQVDLRVVPEESYGAALQYFTGCKAHNITLPKKKRLMPNGSGEMLDHFPTEQCQAYLMHNGYHVQGNITEGQPGFKSWLLSDCVGYERTDTLPSQFLLNQSAAGWQAQEQRLR